MSVTVPQVRPVPRQNFIRDEELRHSRGGVNTISIASTEQRGFERQGPARVCGSLPAGVASAGSFRAVLASGRAQCSICGTPDAADAVNELLLKGERLDTIAQLTGLHRSSIFRHKANPRCYSAWKATRVRSRSKAGHLDGRHVVQWPDGTLTTADGPGEKAKTITITEADLRGSDLLVVVRFEESVPARPQKPPPQGQIQKL